MQSDHLASGTESAASPGARLRRAREARGESVHEAAFAIKLSPRQIEALENDDFAALPGMAFVRGFARNYARYLGLDALGHLYIALLVVNLFSIVPNALQSVQMPRIVQAWDRESAPGVQRGMRHLLMLNLAYCLLAGVALALLAEPVVALVLPKYVGDLYYVYLIVPGLAIYTLTSSVAVMFNVLIRYATYNIGFGMGTVLTIAAFSLTPLFGIVLTLEQVTLVKAAAYALTGLIFLAGFWMLSREHRAFRFSLLPEGMQR